MLLITALCSHIDPRKATRRKPTSLRRQHHHRHRRTCPFRRQLFLPSFPVRSQRIHDTSFQRHEVKRPHPQSFVLQCRVISGTTMSQWIFDRMTMESAALAPSTPNFPVIVPPERKYPVHRSLSFLFARRVFSPFCLQAMSCRQDDFFVL